MRFIIRHAATADLSGLNLTLAWFEDSVATFVRFWTKAEIGRRA
jgi:hypothetical protein